MIQAMLILIIRAVIYVVMIHLMIRRLARLQSY
jgi:hypothetical protein